MKEKIKQLANGIFEYELPGMVFSEEKIEFEVEAGKLYKGSFTAENEKKTPIKGIVYSSQRRMKVLNPSFYGEKNTIEYEFDGRQISPGETVRGNLTIVSSVGEYEVPFSVNALLPYCMTSIGKIRDLFHFANLAKSDWVEAVKLFKSEDFKRVFLKKDLKNIILYENLLKSVSTSQALEEFLIAVHKKLRINLSVDKTSFCYHAEKDSFMDRIVITKDNWGYTEIKISTDVPFIIPDHKMLWADNFIGNGYALEFVLKTEFMRNGKNFGHIFIKTIHQSFTIDITVDCVKEKKIIFPGQEKPVNLSYQYHKCVTGLVENYLKFRSNKMVVSQYAANMRSLLEDYAVLGQMPMLDLLKIHLFMVEGNLQKAMELIKEFENIHEDLEQNQIIEYSALLYLKALITKEDDCVSQAYEKIHTYYNQGYKDFRILWFLLYLDKAYIKNRNKKLEDLMEQFQLGCNSPILYFEAISVYNEDPILLKELDEQTIRIMNWGIKHKEMNKELAVQYTYLAGRRKMFSVSIYRGLIWLYERFVTKDILTALCSMLIKGQKTGDKYFKWYSLGVEQQLRITELHEYYMYSVNEDTNEELPQSLLHYFVYNSSLNDRKKAYLYANIIKNKEKNMPIFTSYFPAIRQFALKQLEQKAVSENLAVIYEEVISKDFIDEKVAKCLPYVMFRYELYCENENIIGIFVVHKELEREQYIPLENGKAQVNLFTENFAIFLVDNKENRYVCTVEYTLKKFLHLDHYAGICYSKQIENEMLVLYLAEQIESYHKFDENIISIRESMLRRKGIREIFLSQGMFSLIRYYYDNFEGEKLEEILEEVDLKRFSPKEQAQVIEYMIIRGKYEKALEEIKKYGYELVKAKRLLRLFGNCFKEDTEEGKNRSVIEFGYFIFQSGKYDEGLLHYLLDYYDGTTLEMYELWKACKGFDLDTELLEERLLGQMLFTEIGGLDTYSVFRSYYVKEHPDKKLIRAYLSYYSYKYLLHDRIVEPELFEVIKKEVMLEENDTGMLAYLKYNSFKETFTEEEAKFMEYNINKFVEKGIVLPFFKNFRKNIPLSSMVSNKYYVEYRTNPKNKVTIHYILENEENQDSFQKETMHNMYQGIFVKDFTLFYNEGLQYYIVEENEDGKNITESITIKVENQPDEEEGKYSLINLMLMTKEMQDEKTLIALIEDYIETEYAEEELFQLL